MRDGPGKLRPCRLVWGNYDSDGGRSTSGPFGIRRAFCEGPVTLGRHPTSSGRQSSTTVVALTTVASLATTSVVGYSKLRRYHATGVTSTTSGTGPRLVVDWTGWGLYPTRSATSVIGGG